MLEWTYGQPVPFAVVVDGPQSAVFRAALDTATVPVRAPTPRWIPAGDEEIFGYQVDLSRLSVEQQRRLGNHEIIPAGDAWSWGNLPALEACTRMIQARAAEAERRRYTRPRRRPKSRPWTVIESEPRPQQCTDLTIIRRDDTPEVFDTVDRRAIAGLQHAVEVADARTRDAMLRAQMAEVRAAASARGQVPVLLWSFVLGLVLGVLVVAVV